VVLSSSSSEGVRVDGSKNQVVGYVTYPLTLIWYHTGGAGEIMNARELMLMEGAHVVAGHSTPAFWKLANRQGPLPRPVGTVQVQHNRIALYWLYFIE
jgi:hypothetical protein